MFYLRVKLTSNTPRHRPSFPITPASSSTSRIAVTEGSSSGSTPPPGTIQLSGRLEDVTSRTYTQHSAKYYHLQRIETLFIMNKIVTNLCFGIWTHANTCRPSPKTLVVIYPYRIRLLLYHFCLQTRKHERNERSQN